MNWIVVQLTTWAVKMMDTAEIAKEIRRRSKISDIELFYPVLEDVGGKHSSAYDEYVFVEYRESIPLNEFEGNEVFRKVLREPDSSPSRVFDEQIESIREQLRIEEQVKVDEVVLIQRGSLRGNYGLVKSSEDGQILLEVYVGDSCIEASLPQKWVRRKKLKKS